MMKELSLREGHDLLKNRPWLSEELTLGPTGLTVSPVPRRAHHGFMLGRGGQRLRNGQRDVWQRLPQGVLRLPVCVGIREPAWRCRVRNLSDQGWKEFKNVPQPKQSRQVPLGLCWKGALTPRKAAGSTLVSGSQAGCMVRGATVGSGARHSWV